MYRLLLLLALCPACFALPKGSYFGGALQATVTLEGVDNPSSGCTPDNAGYLGGGLRAEVGLLRGGWNVYTALRHVQSRYRINRKVDAQSLSTDRVLLGVRLMAPLHDMLLRPTVGAAASLGAGEHYYLHPDRYSPLTLGWLAECDFTIDPHSPLFFTLLGHLEVTDVTLHNALVDYRGHRLHVWNAALEFGTYYRF